MRKFWCILFFITSISTSCLAQSLYFTRAIGETNEVYGIQARQKFFSSSYGDVGYFFLLVDLRNELPIIHVRTWQPDETNTDNLVRINWFKM